MSDGDITAVVSVKTGELKSSIKRLSETATNASVSFSKAGALFESLAPVREAKAVVIEPASAATTYETNVVVSLPTPYPNSDLFVAVLFPEELPHPLLVIVPVKDFPTALPAGSVTPTTVSFKTLAKAFVVAVVTKSDPNAPPDWSISRLYSDLLRELGLITAAGVDPLPLALVNAASDGVLLPSERAVPQIVAKAIGTVKPGFSFRLAVVPGDGECSEAKDWVESLQADSPLLASAGTFKICGSTSNAAGKLAYTASPQLAVRSFSPAIVWASPSTGNQTVPRKSKPALDALVQGAAPNGRVAFYVSPSRGGAQCAGGTLIAADIDAVSGRALAEWSTTAASEGQTLYLCATYASTETAVVTSWHPGAFLIGPTCSGANLSAPLVQLGTGSSTDPYTVCTIEQMQSIGLLVNDHFELGQDIDAAATAVWNGGLGFDPIGTLSTRFRGQLDGKNKVVRNLTINRPALTNTGLFGATRNATLKNIALEDASIVGASKVGALVGFGETTSVVNVRGSGAVTGIGEVGGLVGYLTNGSVMGTATSSILVAASANVAGGLVGFLNVNSSVSNSNASGNVSGIDTIGGLVGKHANWSAITTSSASGLVTGASYVGGLVGESESSLTDSFATGDVTGGATSIGTGGLVGATAKNKVERCFATGDVAASGMYAGGLVGSMAGDLSTETLDSFASGKVTYSGSGTNIGGLAGSTGFGVISDSWAGGAVTASKPVSSYANIGGLSGHNMGTVRRSYATGSVSTTGLAAGPAGLVGTNRPFSSVATISASFATGAISGSWAGGIASLNCTLAACTSGGEQGTTATVGADVRWDSTSSGIGVMCAGQYGLASGCNNANNISGNPTYWYSSSNVPMSSWDFSPTGKWKTAPNTYPILVWQKTHTIFATSTLYNGDLGGLAGADAKCAARAVAAGLTGSWKAMLSTSSMDLRRRLAIQGPIYNRNGELVARHMGDLTDGTLLAAVRYDETAADLNAVAKLVWTGSNQTGRWIGAGTTNGTCSDWSSGLNSAQGLGGDLSSLSITWVRNTSATNCDSLMRLYCIDQ